MNKSFVVLVCLLVSSLDAVVPQIKIQQDHFQQFVNKYNKQYTGDEYNYRKEIFLENLRKIEGHNNQNSTFELGINQFAAMTHKEFVSNMLSKPVSIHNEYLATGDVISSTNIVAPASLDWRTNTNPLVVGPVRNQGACASSVASAIIDSISSDYSIRFAEDFYAFDPAYVDDCVGAQKCAGESASEVWGFISKYGLYWYYEGACPTGPGVGMCISGSNYTKSGSEDDLLSAVASTGPVVIQVDASQPSFQLYKSGVYYDAKCSSSVLNYALLLVGYGSVGDQDYWIARNAWGTSWGQKGDIFLARNKNNNCGVATSASYAKTVQNCVC